MMCAAQLNPKKPLQVLQDLLTMIKKRTHNNQAQQRAARETSRSMSMLSRSDGVDEVERGAFGTGVQPFTSDSSTQVHTVEAASQTELCEFKEKKMRPKHRPREGLSYSDSDVPSEATGSEHNYLTMGGNGRRRRASLGGDSVSLGTSSPRESVDGINDSCYSRDVSDASGIRSASEFAHASVPLGTGSASTHARKGICFQRFSLTNACSLSFLRRPKQRVQHLDLCCLEHRR